MSAGPSCFDQFAICSLPGGFGYFCDKDNSGLPNHTTASSACIQDTKTSNIPPCEGTTGKDYGVCAALFPNCGQTFAPCLASYVDVTTGQEAVGAGYHCDATGTGPHASNEHSACNVTSLIGLQDCEGVINLDYAACASPPVPQPNPPVRRNIKSDNGSSKMVKGLYIGGGVIVLILLIFLLLRIL